MYLIEHVSGMKFYANGGESLLEAATRAGFNFNYSCRTGRCSSCKCKVLSGVTTTLQAETGLSANDRTEGWILSCVRAARSDLRIEAEDLGGITLPPKKTLPCRISMLEKVAPDVIRVYLRLPPSVEFSFIPGQYIDVIGPGGIRRSYSLANADFSHKVLELHIRAVNGGVMSGYWFNHAKVNDLLRLNGPLGTFFLRDSTKVDLIFLATGTGIAPVKAILESIPALPRKQRPKSVTVLWGGRTPPDLYFDVTGIPFDHHFIPVLSRAQGNWTGAKGYVQEVLLATQPNLSNAVVYACGSDAMIHGAKKALVQAGLPDQCFYADAFVCSATSLSS